MFDDLLSIIQFSGTGTHREVPKPKKETRHLTVFTDPETMRIIIDLYINGMPLENIAMYVGIDTDSIDAILDTALPYL